MVIGSAELREEISLSGEAEVGVIQNVIDVGIPCACGSEWESSLTPSGM